MPAVAIKHGVTMVDATVRMEKKPQPLAA